MNNHWFLVWLLSRVLEGILVEPIKPAIHCVYCADADLFGRYAAKIRGRWFCKVCRCELFAL